jgi:hypothetical protein
VGAEIVGVDVSWNASTCDDAYSAALKFHGVPLATPDGATRPRAAPKCQIDDRNARPPTAQTLPLIWVPLAALKSRYQSG